MVVHRGAHSPARVRPPIPTDSAACPPAAAQSFDFDDALPNDNLQDEIHLYPSFARSLRTINRRALALALLLVSLVSLNLILSAVHVLRDFSVGKSSLTGLISNTLLLLPRVLGWTSAAWKAHFANAPISFFSKKASLPNTIDADWRYVPSVYKPLYSAAGKERGETSKGHAARSSSYTPGMACSCPLARTTRWCSASTAKSTRRSTHRPCSKRSRKAASPRCRAARRSLPTSSRARSRAMPK